MTKSQKNTLSGEVDCEWGDFSRNNISNLTDQLPLASIRASHFVTGKGSPEFYDCAHATIYFSKFIVNTLKTTRQTRQSGYEFINRKKNFKKKLCIFLDVGCANKYLFLDQKLHE